MAERRYGFRFSFAEGCVIVISLMSASFLVFLFGVYAGREMESHKAAAYSRTTRLAIAGEEQPHLLPQEGESVSSPKEGQERKSSNSSSSSATQEKQATVVVVSPSKLNEPLSNMSASTSAAPAPLQEKEPPTRSEPPQPQTRLISPKSLPPTPLAVARVPVREQQNQMKMSPIIPSTPQSKPKGGRWSVQVNATRDEGTAQQLAKQLRSQGHIPIVSKIERDGEVWYRVRVGSFASAEEAKTSVERFRREGKFLQAYPTSD